MMPPPSQFNFMAVAYLFADVLRRRNGGRALRSERGQSAIEVTLLLGLLAAMALFINSQLAPVVLDVFQAVAKSVSSIGP